MEMQMLINILIFILVIVVLYATAVSIYAFGYASSEPFYNLNPVKPPPNCVSTFGKCNNKPCCGSNMVCGLEEDGNFYCKWPGYNIPGIK
jgi:hypothetical protein